ncbi:winged helix-turn-helix domain-containing protein [Gracilinema caldarium]|uniref:winged helix-turn-helix domain-containing protein n=1 Tax=Gracilinema caldarium TaxID=215591 RepID=UPI0026F1F773|nr:winged helix-turn-helix domain-containing protein [Gracilinema caldarium]
MFDQGNLYVIGADPAVQSWFRAAQFPFSVILAHEVPEKAAQSTLVLVPNSLIVSKGYYQLNNHPFISYGNLSEIETAFFLGARDFISYPFDYREFTVRVSRQLFMQREIQFPEYNISLHDKILKGPAGTIELNDTEALILRMLAVSEKHQISRSVLQGQLWPGRQKTSRIADMAVCRLRRKLERVSDKNKSFQIKTLYGFGYQL